MVQGACVTTISGALVDAETLNNRLKKCNLQSLRVLRIYMKGSRGPVNKSIK
jgi:hypothetical protein